MNPEGIKCHYKTIAKTFGISPLSTMKDQFIRASEMDFFLMEIFEFIETHHYFPRILDVGCGNGYLLRSLKELLPEIKLWGLEFTPELFSLTCQKSAKVYLGDILSPPDFKTKFDIIICQRVLINLLSWKRQKLALENIKNLLNSQGLLLLSESFYDPLKELNELCEQNKLPTYSPSSHNLYLRKYKFLAAMKNLGFIKAQTHLPQNYLSTHFFLTRVFHPLIRPQGTRVIGSKIVNFLESQLQTAQGNYSPILFKKFLMK